MPCPLTYFRKVKTVLRNVLIMSYQCIAHFLEQVCTPVTKLRQAVYGVGTGKMTIDEAVAGYGSFEQ